MSWGQSSATKINNGSAGARKGGAQGGAQKTIFHMDGDAFFVGVEVAKNPALRGLPVVTGEERGIVSALSYEAKALGIIRGMPTYRVKKDFPSVIILPGDYASYARYSTLMFDIVRRYADVVEEYSIDECFADLTGLDRPLYMSYRQIAERIKSEVVRELGLSISIGLAPTKVLAKVASKWQKPNGLTVIELGNISEFLKQTSIGKIWGIGPRTADLLIRHHILNAQDFVDRGIAWVSEHLSRPYKVMWHELSGTSIMVVDPETKETYSSIQKTRTFHPSTNDKTFLLSQLSKNIEDACAKARHYRLVPKKVSFFLKTQEFRYSECSIPLDSPSHAPEVIMNLARMYFSRMHTAGMMYRTTGVTLRDLAPESCTQLDLFGGTETTHKFETIHEQMDALQAKFGKRVVYLASTHQALQHREGGTDADEIERDLLFL